MVFGGFHVGHIYNYMDLLGYDIISSTPYKKKMIPRSHGASGSVQLEPGDRPIKVFAAYHRTSGSESHDILYVWFC